MFDNKGLRVLGLPLVYTQVPAPKTSTHRTLVTTRTSYSLNEADDSRWSSFWIVFERIHLCLPRRCPISIAKTERETSHIPPSHLPLKKKKKLVTAEGTWDMTQTYLLTSGACMTVGKFFLALLPRVLIFCNVLSWESTESKKYSSWLSKKINSIVHFLQRFKIVCASFKINRWGFSLQYVFFLLWNTHVKEDFSYVYTWIFFYIKLQ